MRLSEVAKLAAKAAMILGILLAVVVLLAAMPGHRVPAAPQSNPTKPSDRTGQQQDMGDPHHDMPGMSMSDEKMNEQHAVRDMHDMMEGHHHMSGPHMQMTSPRPETPQDVEHAEHIVKDLRGGIEKYTDYRVALADGYRIFLPNLPQKEYHFTNYKNGFLEAFTFDPARPTSLLYRKTRGGYELVGAMYTMPKTATEDQLNGRIPLSVATWHLHTNLCMPPRDQLRIADWKKFGLQGSIATQEACDAAGGRFRPVIFGWMVHVYPYHDSIAEVFAH